MKDKAGEKAFQEGSEQKVKEAEAKGSGLSYLLVKRKHHLGMLEHIMDLSGV